MDRTVCVFISWHHPTQKFQNIAKWVCFGPLFFNLIHLIQLCDKKNLTFIGCWDKIFNQLPDDKILDWFKLNQIADDISKCI